MPVAWSLNSGYFNGYNIFGGTWEDLLAPTTHSSATTNNDFGGLATATAR